VHVGLTLPVICSTGKKRWNFLKADWDRFAASTEKSIPMVFQFTALPEPCPKQLTPLSQGIHTMYVPCMDEEAQTLQDKNEKSGDPDIADHLIESLDAARCARWEESTARMNYSHSSQKSWALLCQLGAAQRPPQSPRPPVSAYKVASHLVLVAKAPANKAFKRKVCDGWHQAR